MIKPVNGQIFVTRPNDASLGKIALPANASGEKERFTGDVVDSSSPLCKAGDRVMFSRCQVFKYADLAGEKHDITVVDAVALVGVEAGKASHKLALTPAVNTNSDF